MNTLAREVLSVARLTRAVRMLLEGHFGAVWVEGEISNLARPSSGHLYFSLKDEAAQIRCAMFRARNSLLGFAPANGAQVLLSGRVSLYEPRGEFQLIVEHMEPAGDGLLRMKFEALKRTLAADGLFEAEHKQALPVWPTQIGIISSPTGAAVRDILQVLRRRNPAIPIILYPTPVQGSAAIPGVVHAIKTANQRAECSVLIVARGGGSLEDLWAFNEEAVVRAIYDSTIPIITGVGHEIDYTLADLAADVRAPTPSAAAELCVPDGRGVLRQVHAFEQRLTRTTQQRLQQLTVRTHHAMQRLIHPGRRIEQHHQRLDELARRLPQAIQHTLALCQARLRSRIAELHTLNPRARLGLLAQRIEHLHLRLPQVVRMNLARAETRVALAKQILNAVSPLATLERGYAIVTAPDGRIARRALKIEPGSHITARLADGSLACTVDQILLEEATAARRAP